MIIYLHEILNNGKSGGKTFRKFFIGTGKYCRKVKKPSGAISLLPEKPTGSFQILISGPVLILSSSKDSMCSDKSEHSHLFQGEPLLDGINTYKGRKEESIYVISKSRITITSVRENQVKDYFQSSEIHTSLIEVYFHHKLQQKDLKHNVRLLTLVYIYKSLTEEVPRKKNNIWTSTGREKSNFRHIYSVSSCRNQI